MRTLTRRSLLAAAPALISPLKGASQAERPNILLMMADDLSQECLSCYGATSFRTPNLDRLATQGIRFTHAYSQPLCTPTRVQLMTGQHNFRNWKGFGLIDPQEKTFGHMMQRGGYRTAIAGKWQFYSYDGPKSPRYAKGMLPEQSGFDEYLLWHDRYTENKGSRYAEPVFNQNGKSIAAGKDDYGPDLCFRFLDGFFERNRQQPFFAYYSMVLTHGPFNPTPRSADWAHGNRLKDDPKYYADMVQYLDEDVGRVLASLDRLGLRERTLVLFYSDNGTPREVTFDRSGRAIRGGKGLTTRGGMHVPLIAHWQGHGPAGVVCQDLVDSTDFVPTMSAATGVKWFDGLPLDGRSFLPQVKGTKGSPRDHLFAHYDPHPGCKQPFPPTRLTWDQRWKLYPDGRLFDTQKDEFEESPIAPETTDRAARAARKRLQTGLDRMAKVAAPKFNKFESDDRPAY